MTKDFNVSVSMDQAAAVKTGVILKQGDFGFDLKITVLDFVVTGTTPQIVFRKAMGAVESTDVTASGNVYTYTFKGTELDVPGKVFCDLKLKNSTTQRISTASFMFEVVADTLDGLAEESSSYSDTIAQIVGGFNDDINNVKVYADVPTDAVVNTSKVVGERNECTANTVSASTFIRGQDGATRSGSTYASWSAVTAFIPLPNNGKIAVKSCNVYFYSTDSVEGYLGYIEKGINEGGVYDYLENAAYIRLCWHNTRNAYVVIRDSAGKANVIFNGNNGTFVGESIPSSAVAGVPALISESIPLKNIQKTLHEKNECKSNEVSTSTLIRSQDGQVRTGSDYSNYNAVVEYLPVTDTGTVLQTNCVTYFYDSSKVYISYFDTNGVHDIPSGAAYMRLCWTVSQDPTANAIIRNANNEAGVTFDGTDTEFVDQSIPAEAVEGVSSLLNDQGPLKNIQKMLHEKNECTSYYISSSTFIRTQDGQSRSGTDYSQYAAVLEYIPLESGDYIKHTACYLYFYDSSKAFLSYLLTDGTTEAPSGAAYMRLCWLVSGTPNVVIQDANGSAAATFDGTKGEIVDESIPAEAVEGVGPVVPLAHYKDLTLDKWEDGKYLRSQDGAVRTNSSFKCVEEYLNLSGITSIFAHATDTVFYESDTTFISYVTTRDTWITPPADAGLLRASCSINNSPYILAKTADGTLIVFEPEGNVEFANKCIPFNAIDAEGVPATLPPSVKMIATTGGDYTSIVEANARCDGSYAMWVLPGVYEGGWSAADDTYGHKRNRKVYVGLEKNACVAERYGSAYAEDVFHTNGNSYMKNLSLKAKKSTGATSCGYALHLDNGWLKNGTAVFEDCYFSSEGRAAAGIGTRPNCNIVFRNCVFETDFDGNGAVFFHNNPTVDEGGNQGLYFENCVFHAKNGVALQVQEIGGDDNDIVLTMINCTFYSDTLGVSNIVSVLKNDYTGSGTGNVNLTAYSHGNNIDIASILNA